MYKSGIYKYSVSEVRSLFVEVNVFRGVVPQVLSGEQVVQLQPRYVIDVVDLEGDSH